MPFCAYRCLQKMSSETQGAKRSSEPLDLRALIETIPALVVCALADGSAEFANRAWQEYTGRPLQQLTGSSWHTAIHPDDLSKFFHDSTVGLMPEKSVDVEARLRRADGQYRWFSVRKTLAVSRTQDGEPSLRTLIACEDIEERKEEESARRFTEKQYRLVVETASDAVICLDESSAILLANPATTQIFGYAPAELIGKPLTMLMPEFLRKLHEAGFKRYLATGQRHINWQGTELTGLRKNGQEFPVEVSFGELTKDGHRTFTGFIRDISERKQAEEIRKQAQKAIQTAQAELARVSRLTTMGELAASIAHEVNQPLTAVTNNSNACLRLLANQNLQPDVLRRALEEIVADGTRASAIIARIRAFIKKAPVEKTRLDVNEVIREVLAMMGHGFEENRISLQSELAETLPPVLADRVQLQQVLLNLVINGIEAMAVVTDRPRELCVQSRIDESGDVLVAVRDSGSGLVLEADRVFTPFFTTKANGIGMGLPISRSIIEGLGGRLWATPNSRHGAVFSFTLPIAAGTPL
jgi:two-component system, LuxR family, sensor kinase FixL